MVGVVVLWMALVGCGAPEPVPTPMPPPPPKAKAPKPSVRAKAKTGNLVHGKAKAKAPRGKAPRGKAPARRPPPVGGEGELRGHLVLDVEEKPGSEGSTTEARMVLAWDDDQAAEVLLGSVDGVCRSVEPMPVGPAQHTPLWTVACDDQGKTDELYILQAKSLLVVVRGTPGADKPMVYKPVRRIPLRPTAKLVRSDAPPPEVKGNPGSDAAGPAGTEPAAPKAPGSAPAPASAAPAPAAGAPAPDPSAPAPSEGAPSEGSPSPAP